MSEETILPISPVTKELRELDAEQKAYKKVSKVYKKYMKHLRHRIEAVESKQDDLDYRVDAISDSNSTNRFVLICVLALFIWIVYSVWSEENGE